MDLLSNLYSKAAFENERNLRFWEDYLKSLKELDFKAYSEKLSVPVLVPIGSRILFRGELKHTNEIVASIGADYFAKCSISQAEILRQHRIKDAQSKVDMYIKGKEYLENQLSFRKDNIYDNGGQEIVEVYSEEEDRAWRVKHRENVRQYKLQSKNERDNKEEITDEELWNRLEELELQEELENELGKDGTQDTEPAQNNEPPDSYIEKEEDSIPSITNDNQKEFTFNKVSNNKMEEITNNQIMTKVGGAKRPAQISKLDLLQKVIDRQNKLDERLQELKNKERSRSKTEKDLMSRLDEMDQLDELEDEMDRLDDIIEGEDVDSDEDTEDDTKCPAPIVKRSVSFADEDDSETIDITFKHSDALPCTEDYDQNKGIQKPSDIYSAYSNLFSETTSILKKKKYSENTGKEIVNKEENAPKITFMQTEEDEEEHENVNKTIIVRDVVERVDQNGNMVENTETRPTSLFKKKRMQKKS